MADDDLIKEAQEAFSAAQEREAKNRDQALEDARFALLSEQWPPEVEAQRKEENRPCLTINRLPAVIRQVVNDARQNKPAIICAPVDDHADPDTADVLNGLIRNIEQTSNAEVAYDTALAWAVVGGFGYFKIGTRYTDDDSFDQDIVIERVANPFAVYGDPNSTAADSADWDTAFELEAMTKAQFEARWADADPSSFSGDGVQGLVKQEQDLVTIASFWRRDRIKKRIYLVANEDGTLSQIVDEATLKARHEEFAAMGLTVQGRPREVEGYKVRQHLLSGGDALETVDWAGKYIPIVPVYGDELNIEGDRFLWGMVRDAKDPQRMFNYWRTVTTELAALAPKAPFIGPVGAFDTDRAKWESANNATHAFIEYDGSTPPQRQPFSGVPAGAMQEALNASDDIKAVTGIYDASLGARSNETSGRAIMARQREGDVSTFHYIDNLSRAIRHAGRILVDLIPKVYTGPRMVRVLGAEGELQRALVVDSPAAPPPEGLPKDVVGVFALGVGKYDVTVKAGPSYTSRREEAATQMIELIRAFPAAAPVIGDLLAKNLDWPGAEEVAKRLAALLPPEVREAEGEGEDPVVGQAKAAVEQVTQQAKQMLQQASAQMQALQAEVDALKQKHDLEARKLDIDAYEAETRRMVAMQPKPLPGMPRAGSFL